MLCVGALEPLEGFVRFFPGGVDLSDPKCPPILVLLDEFRESCVRLLLPPEGVVGQRQVECSL